MRIEKQILQTKAVAGRRPRGAALGLVAALALALVILGIAIFSLIMLMGGSKEVRNAVDSGALSVGRNALTVTVAAPASAGTQFDDVADSNTKFGLPNINRVWGEAYLVAANANAMNGEGTTNGSTASDAQLVHDSAQQISDALYQALQPQSSTFFNFFSQIAVDNSLRMLGKATKVQAVNDSKWSISCMDRGADSNLIIQPYQFPDGYTVPPTATAQSIDAQTCMAGYAPITVDNNNFWFVPFHWNEKPHLVSEDHFEATDLTNNPVSFKNPPQPATGTVAWQNPVPNSFSVHGKSIQQEKYAEQAVSWVTTNPQTRYPLAIPHGWIKIKIDENTAHYQTLMMPIPLDDSYGFITEEQAEPALPVPGCGVGTVVALMGNEYLPPTIHQAIFASPDADYTAVRHRLVQRIQEIKQSFQDSDLDAVLNQPLVPLGSSLEYIIFADSSNNIQIQPTSQATATAPWLGAVVSEDPDGSPYSSYSESFIPMTPNIVESWSLEGTGCSEGPLYALQESGQFTWTPATGYNGNLGLLEIKRDTTVLLFGGCACP